eukprot:3074623-Amphidinium_carterae.1
MLGRQELAVASAWRREQQWLMASHSMTQASWTRAVFLAHGSHNQPSLLFSLLHVSSGECAVSLMSEDCHPDGVQQPICGDHQNAFEAVAPPSVVES